MTRIRIDHDAVARAADALVDRPEVMTARLVGVVNQASLLGQRETQDRTPTVSGISRNSIIAAQAVATGGRVSGGWGSAAPHMPALEFGSRPHMPPVSPLIDWARQKLGLSGPAAQRAGWAVAKKSCKVGTEGAFMFRDATEAISADVNEMIAGAVEATLASLQGDA